MLDHAPATSVAPVPFIETMFNLAGESIVIRASEAGFVLSQGNAMIRGLPNAFLTGGRVSEDDMNTYGPPADSCKLADQLDDLSNLLIALGQSLRDGASPVEALAHVTASRVAPPGCK